MININREDEYGKIVFREDNSNVKKQFKKINIVLTLPFIFLSLIYIGSIKTDFWLFMLLNICLSIFPFLIWWNYTLIRALEIREKAIIMPNDSTPRHLRNNDHNYKNMIIPFDDIEIIYPNICERGSKITLRIPDGPIIFKSDKKKEKFIYPFKDNGLFYVMIKLKDSSYRRFDKSILLEEMIPTYKVIIQHLEEKTTISRDIMLMNKPPGAV